MMVLENVSDICKFTLEISSAIKQGIRVSVRNIRRAKRAIEQVQKVASEILYLMYTMTTWFASNVIKIVMTDAMRVVNADMDNIILSMNEDAHIIGKLVIHVILLDSAFFLVPI